MILNSAWRGWAWLGGVRSGKAGIRLMVLNCGVAGLVVAGCGKVGPGMVRQGWVMQGKAGILEEFGAVELGVARLGPVWQCRAR
jgi:hypothetical protein